MVLWESVWFYGLIRKSIIKEKSEGGRGRREGDIKGAGMFCPSSARASNTFNNETGNKTHWHRQLLTPLLALSLTHTRSKMACLPDVRTDCLMSRPEP